MRKILDKTPERVRKDLNNELIQRMRNGEDLSKFDASASWYPPRPNTKKDFKAIQQLYGNTDSEASSSRKTVEIVSPLPQGKSA